MKRIFSIIILLSACLAKAQTAWPSQSWGNATNLTSVVSSSGIDELSGLHWNPLNNCLYGVRDDGRLYVLQLNGSIFTLIANKALSGGPEGITMTDEVSTFYVMDENNYHIEKYTHNTTFGNLNLAHHWNLLQSPSPMTDTGNTGPEGITFVPDSFLTSEGFISQATGQFYTSVKGMGGLMFVAHQDEGYIWVFDVNPFVDDDFAYVGKYKSNRLESCDLDFDKSTGLLYILHNVDANYLEIAHLSSTLTNSTTRKLDTYKEYFIPNPADGNINIEGVAVMPKCNGDMVWLCRDVSNDDSSAIQHDVLRWFDPFPTDGVCGALSVDQSAQNDMQIYPNPGSGQVSISIGNNQGASIRIVNSLGQQVFSGTTAEETFSFDSSPLASGMYFIEISKGQNTSRLKWIKS